MKCRIWYRPVHWQSFDKPNPTPWRLDIPVTLFRRLPPIATEYRTWGEAVAAWNRVIALAPLAPVRYQVSKQ